MLLLFSFLLFWRYCVCSTVFVSYVHDSSVRDAQSHLRFFLHHGVKRAKHDGVDYGLFIVGTCITNECLKPRMFLEDKSIDVMVLQSKTATTGYLGAHTAMLDNLASASRLKYDYYIFINSYAVGPFIPAYMPEEWHWTSAFGDKLQGSVGLVTTVMQCSPKFGPRISSSAFAMSAASVKSLSSARNHFSGFDSALDSDRVISHLLGTERIGIDSLLLAYRGIDWTNRSESAPICRTNSNAHEENPYAGISINPFEVLFHEGPKYSRSDYMITDVNKYLRWNEQKIHRKQGSNVQVYVK